jgi:hypothetical protein
MDEIGPSMLLSYESVEICQNVAGLRLGVHATGPARNAAISTASIGTCASDHVYRTADGSCFSSDYRLTCHQPLR